MAKVSKPNSSWHSVNYIHSLFLHAQGRSEWFI